MSKAIMLNPQFGKVYLQMDKFQVHVPFVWPSNTHRKVYLSFLLLTFVPVQKVCVNIYIYIYIYALLYEFCFLWFTNCVLLLGANSLIPGCLWLLTFVLNNTLGIWCSTIPHLPGCFCPWAFFQNIGFNIVSSEPFMSHLSTQLGHSAGEFQALQLIVLATFGIVD